MSANYSKIFEKARKIDQNFANEMDKYLGTGRTDLTATEQLKLARPTAFNPPKTSTNINSPTVSTTEPQTLLQKKVNEYSGMTSEELKAENEKLAKEKEGSSFGGKLNAWLSSFGFGAEQQYYTPASYGANKYMDSVGYDAKAENKKNAEAEAEKYSTERNTLAGIKATASMYKETKGKEDYDSFQNNINTKQTFNLNHDATVALGSVNRYNLEDVSSLIFDKYGVDGVELTGNKSTDVSNVKKRLREIIGETESTLKKSSYDYDSAKWYAEHLDKQNTYEKEMEVAKKFASKTHFVSSLTTHIANIAAGTDFVVNTVKSIGHSDPTNLESYIPLQDYDFIVSSYMNTVKEQVGEDIEKKLPNWEIAGTNIASFLYQTQMSVGDNLLLLATVGQAFGEFGTLAVMGSSAASTAMAEAVENGSTNAEAILTGLAHGAAEVITEKVSLDQLPVFDTSKVSIKTAKELSKMLLKQSVVEGSEEVSADLMNYVSDALILGSNSDSQRRIQQYEAEGLTSEQAKKKVFQENLYQTLWSGIGGFLSGFMMGGPTGAISLHKSNMAYSSLAKSATKGKSSSTGETNSYDFSEEIQKGKALEKGSVGNRAAIQLERQVKNGKSPNSVLLGRLVAENMAHVQDNYQILAGLVNSNVMSQKDSDSVMSDLIGSKAYQYMLNIQNGNAFELQLTSGQVTLLDKDVSEMSGKYSEAVAEYKSNREAKVYSLYVHRGLPLKIAQGKANVVNKLVAGEDVSNAEIDSLNLKSKSDSFRDVFYQATGVRIDTSKDIYSQARSAQYSVPPSTTADIQRASEELSKTVNNVQATQENSSNSVGNTQLAVIPNTERGLALIPGQNAVGESTVRASEETNMIRENGKYHIRKNGRGSGNLNPGTMQSKGRQQTTGEQIESRQRALEARKQELVQRRGGYQNLTSEDYQEVLDIIDEQAKLDTDAQMLETVQYNGKQVNLAQLYAAMKEENPNAVIDKKTVEKKFEELKKEQEAQEKAAAEEEAKKQETAKVEESKKAAEKSVFDAISRRDTVFYEGRRVNIDQLYEALKEKNPDVTISDAMKSFADLLKAQAEVDAERMETYKAAARSSDASFNELVKRLNSVSKANGKNITFKMAENENADVKKDDDGTIHDNGCWTQSTGTISFSRDMTTQEIIRWLLPHELLHQASHTTGTKIVDEMLSGLRDMNSKGLLKGYAKNILDNWDIALADKIATHQRFGDAGFNTLEDSVKNGTEELVADMMRVVMPQTKFWNDLVAIKKPLAIRISEKLRSMLGKAPTISAFDTEVKKLADKLDDAIGATEEQIEARETKQTQKSDSQKANEQTETEDQTTPEVTPESATEAIADEEAVQESYDKHSLNINTFEYAKVFTGVSESTETAWKSLLRLSQIQSQIGSTIKDTLPEGHWRMNIHNINEYLAKNKDVWQELIDIQEESIKSGVFVDFVTPIQDTWIYDGKEVEAGLKGIPIEYVPKEKTGGYKFNGFARTLGQMYLDKMDPNARRKMQDEFIAAVEDAYNKKLTMADPAPELVKMLDAVVKETEIRNIASRTNVKAQTALRSAQKPVAALNLNSACPMFTIGNHGCYLDACYLTQMGGGGNTVNLFQSAIYAGEILQLSQHAIDVLNADPDGLRVNGVGDTIKDNEAALFAALRHANMRGLKLKIITKQVATLELLREAKKQGIDISRVTVQLSMDNLWIPAALDDAWGSGVRGEIGIAEYVKRGDFKNADIGYDYFYGRATKEDTSGQLWKNNPVNKKQRDELGAKYGVQLKQKKNISDSQALELVDKAGTVWRKYGFTDSQVLSLVEEYSEINILPRYVVCTASEIAELALGNGALGQGPFIQTLMHGYVPAAARSDYPGEILNFGSLRHVVEKKNGVWEFYGARVSKNEETGKVEIKRASSKAHKAVDNYIKANYTKEQQEIIYTNLQKQLCCKASEKLDACAGCQSLFGGGCSLCSAVKAKKNQNFKPDASLLDVVDTSKGVTKNSLSRNGGTDAEGNSYEFTDMPKYQDHTSAGTSLPHNRPTVYNKVNWEVGTKNLDIGGGKTEYANELLKENGVENFIMDPYNRDADYNLKAIDSLINGEQFDTVTCANVLNVIDSARSRSNVILEAAKALKPDGTAYFQIYEGDSKKESGEVKNKPDQYQGNRKTKTYIPEIEQWFESVVPMKGQSNVLVATNPKANLPKAYWEYEEGKAVKYSLTEKEQKNYDKNVSNTTPGTTLYTVQNGSKIEKDPKHGIGKYIGGDLYFHNDADAIAQVRKTEPAFAYLFENAKKALEKYDPNYQYNGIRFTTQAYVKGEPNPKLHVVAFQEAPGFDSEPEPRVGRTVNVYPDGTVKESRASDTIWHHKWLWVTDDYKGFDTTAAWERSKEFLNGLTVPTNGSNLKNWNQQLKDNGLGHLVVEQDGAENSVKYSLTGYAANGMEIYESDPSVLSLPWKDRKKLFLDYLTNEYLGRTAKFYNPTTKEVSYARFDRDDIQKTLYGDKKSDSAGHDAVINTGASGNIFELVENSTYAWSREEKGKNISSHKNVTGWDYYVKTVQIDGKVFDLIANVRKKPAGEFVYSIQMNENNTKAPALPRASADIAARSNNGAPTGAYNASVAQNDAKSQEKKFSLTARERMDAAHLANYNAFLNGDTTAKDDARKQVLDYAEFRGWEPKNLYHGTKSFGFTKFDLNKLDDGISIFTTDSLDTAETYSGSAHVRELTDAAIPAPKSYATQDLVDWWNEYLPYNDPVKKLSNSEAEELLNGYKSHIQKAVDAAGRILDKQPDLVGSLANLIPDAKKPDKTVLNQFDSDFHTLLNVIKSMGNVDDASSYVFADDMITRIHRLLYSSDASVLLPILDQVINYDELVNYPRFTAALLRNIENKSGIIWSGNKVRDTEFSFMTADAFRSQVDQELSYSKEEGQGNYQLLGKSENPLVIDVNGENWNDIYLDSTDIIDAYNAIAPADERISPNINGFLNTRDITKMAKLLGYDSVKFESIVDDGGQAEYGAGMLDPADITVFFNPAAVKSADPFTFDDNGDLIPLSKRFDDKNEDIRYSLTPEFQKQFDDLIAEYGAQAKGYRDVREELFPKRTAPTNKVERSVRTIANSQATPEARVDALREAVVDGKFDYQPVTNKGLQRDAEDWLAQKKDFNVAAGAWLSDIEKGVSNPEMTARGAVLLNVAGDGGVDAGIYLQIAQAYARLLKTAGQTVEGAKIFQNMTPSGKLFLIIKGVEKINDTLTPKQKELNREKFGFEEIQIPEELIEKYGEAQTDADRDEVITEIAKEVAKQVPSTFADRFTALRYLNMLGNIKTQVRNVVGNAMFQPIRMTKDIVASALESVFKTEERTAASVGDKESFKVGLKLADQFMAEMQSGGKYNDDVYSGFAEEVRRQKQIFGRTRVELYNKTLGKALEGYRKVTNWSMEQGDVIFNKFAFADSIAKFMKANNTTWENASKSLQERAINKAIREAQESTYHDNNTLSMWVSSFARGQNTPKIVKLLAEGVLPFRKTPANILMRAYEYSPISIVENTVKSIQKGKGKSEISANDLINRWAKTLTGTGLVMLGYALAAMGVLIGKRPDDDKEGALFDQQGYQAYSLRAMGRNFTLDWLAPESIPMFLGANIAQAAISEGMTLEEGAAAIMAIGDPLLQMSMLQGINDALDNASSYGNDNALVSFITNAVWSYATQGLTNTLVGQIKRGTNNTRMTTYVDEESWVPKTVQRGIGKAIAKIPGISWNQVAYIDAWGDEEKNARSGVGNFLTQLFSPAYVSEEKKSDMLDELNRLVEVTGDTSVVLQKPGKSFTYSVHEGTNNTVSYTKNMSAEEYVAYCTVRGGTAKQIVSDLISSKEYQKLSDAEKIEAINKAYDYATDVAKSEILPKEKALSGTSAKVRQGYVEEGIPEATYMTISTNVANLKENWVDETGEKISNSNSIFKMRAIYDSAFGLTQDQIDYLAEALGVSKTVRKYNKNLIYSKASALERKYAKYN